MNYCIIVFRAKSHTINFANILKSYRVPCEIINTPRAVNVSCGISVRFSYNDLDLVKQIISRRNFDTFGGIYQLVGNGINYKVVRLS